MPNNRKENAGQETHNNLVGFNQHRILVPRTVRVAAVVRMAAALMSYDMHIKSVDQQLKQYWWYLEARLEPQYVMKPGPG